VHYRDLCDIEFTVEAGRLWLLQTRVGKRGCVAAVRIAVDLVDDPLVDVDEAEAVARVPAEVRARARAELLAASTDGGLDEELLATGLGASPGRVTGRVVLTTEDAVDAEDDVVLVRRETSPEDVAGMSASVGVLTTRGGLVSHAAVVARAWGLPAVVGAEQLTIDGDVVTGTDGLSVRAGDVVTIDGTTGCVWRGAVAGRPAEEEVQDDRVAARLPHLERLERWALEREGALA
jgi:pyruvate, orthophosphate dikinase